jgi:hypothetical protein
MNKKDEKCRQITPAEPAQDPRFFPTVGVTGAFG